MDKTEVQMEIARLLGYTIGKHSVPSAMPTGPSEIIWKVLLRPDGTIFKHNDSYPRCYPNEPKAEAYLLAYAGDWCDDIDEALALCQKLAVILDCVILFDQVYYSDDGDTEVAFVSKGSNCCGAIEIEHHYEVADKDVAFALAKLALNVLRVLKPKAIKKLVEENEDEQ